MPDHATIFAHGNHCPAFTVTTPNEDAFVARLTSTAGIEDGAIEGHRSCFLVDRDNLGLDLAYGTVALVDQVRWRNLFSVAHRPPSVLIMIAVCRMHNCLRITPLALRRWELEVTEERCYHRETAYVHPRCPADGDR